jgi:hypothetical protein
MAKKKVETNGVGQLCGEPEVPDLSDAQIIALHKTGDFVQQGIDVASSAGVDIRTTLAILMMRLTGANCAIIVNGVPIGGKPYPGAAIGVGYAAGTTSDLDEMAKTAAKNLYVAMDHNLRLQVRYKRPDQFKAKRAR